MSTTKRYAIVSVARYDDDGIQPVRHYSSHADYHRALAHFYGSLRQAERVVSPEGWQPVGTPAPSEVFVEMFGSDSPKPIFSRNVKR